MKVQIAAVEKTGTDATGRFAALGIRAPNGDRHAIQMTIDIASVVIAQLASAGIESAKVRGLPDGPPPDGEEHIHSVRATFADASLGPSGQALMVLRFGTVTVSALLDPSAVRELAKQLTTLSIQGPATHQ